MFFHSIPSHGTAISIGAGMTDAGHYQVTLVTLVTVA